MALRIGTIGERRHQIAFTDTVAKICCTLSKSAGLTNGD